MLFKHFAIADVCPLISRYVPQPFSKPLNLLFIVSILFQVFRRNNGGHETQEKPVFGLSVLSYCTKMVSSIEEDLLRL